MWLYIVLLCVLHRVESIRLLSLDIPDRVQTGQKVPLSCLYQLEGDDKLYSIKWYRNNVEFFRFVASDNQKLTFPIQGIQVDVDRSGNGTVFIKDVITNTSGTYSCEISADAPTFQTILKEKFMAVEESNDSPSASAGEPSPFKKYVLVAIGAVSLQKPLPLRAWLLFSIGLLIN